MKYIVKLLKNPLTIWLKRILNNIILELDNQYLEIGYMSSIRKSKFKKYNSIGDFTSLNKVSIDDFSYVANLTKIFNCEIGKFCSIGSDCKIGLSIHPKNIISTHPFFYKKFKKGKFNLKELNFSDQSEKIIIGNDVWIGDDVTIFGGVKIGDGAVIGTKSLVTKDIEPYSIVAGIPAKQIGNRNSKLRKKWWLYSKDELLKLRHLIEKEFA